ncbi:IS5 family transposase [Castellaniella defragrans]|uniref:IS5 family transposase n=1 Tax=Castellaniella defragrans TaxID=75697 RepID=A0A7W9TR35_CASDE|nr:IS5 family transposase [Castellaniella defragrans]KAB0622516.1 IS5 family transposase [Castellaniella defragrans]MBB6084826.1 IS5 family transposase [Castellaniella defragrans]
MSQIDDFFRSRLDQMIDLCKPLAVLATHIPWQEMEAAVAHRFARQVRTGKWVEDIDLFGLTMAVVGAGHSSAGRPRLPMRLMISLLYLKHTFNESDEDVCERWSETPVWQYFSGQEYFENRRPCDPSAISRFRGLLGEEGVEGLLVQMLVVAINLGLIECTAMESVIVNSTVQSKAVTHPTDSRLLEVARQKIADAAKAHGIALKQSYAKKGRDLARKAGRYTHAKQYRRMHKTIKRQRTILGRSARDIERSKTALARDIQDALDPLLAQAYKIAAQSRKGSRPKGHEKIYSWHAPEVECISKGKARTPYEFGVKVGIAITLKGNLIVGARSFPGNPYDGHTLAEQLKQSSILMEAIGVRPQTVYTDLGYRGVDGEIPEYSLKHRGKFKRLTDQERQTLKRRQAVEPVIGHLKGDHEMNRCHLKGQTGDAIHTVLCAAGFNIRWLLRMIARKGISPLFLSRLFAWMRQQILAARSCAGLSQQNPWSRIAGNPA